MKLIVAEKASVAKNIAAVVGAKRTGKYMEGSDYIVTHCVGHLCSLAMPEDYDSNLKKWHMSNLPIIPETYKQVVVKNTAAQFNVVKQLMLDPRVTSIINACDGDREGESIFRKVYEEVGCKKPVERLWISSMENQAIADGLKKLKPMSEYDSLARAANCRDIADWLIGINLTRLYTTKFHANPFLAVGRVQIPTTNMVVEREREIRNFKPVDYWILSADLGDFVVTRRSNDEQEANTVVSACKGATATITSLKETEQKKGAPKLYDLTSLQQDCNRMFGMSATETLEGLQTLYEGKMATYPRTSSQYITDDEVPMARAAMNEMAKSAATSFVKQIFSDSQVHFDRISAIVNNKKVEGHPALLPTVSGIKALNEDKIGDKRQRDIMALLCCRLIEATSPEKVSLVTKVVADISNYDFEASGTVLKSPGWFAVDEAKKKLLNITTKKTEDTILPEVHEGDKFQVQSIKKDKKQTKPPQRYTEATLLDAMKNCGKKLENEEQREAMKDRGLGTPATRAEILKKIIITSDNPTGYITKGLLDKNGRAKDKNHLYPTDRAEHFMDVLPDLVKNPSTTGEWEYKLALIQKGDCSDEEFMADINQFVISVVEHEKNHSYTPDEFTALSNQKASYICPACGNNMIPFNFNTKKDGTKLKTPISGFSCINKECGMRIRSTVGGKKLTNAQMKKLIENGTTEVISGFYSNAKGKFFSASVALEKDAEGKYTGRQIYVFPKDGDGKVLCKCPICGKNVTTFEWTKTAKDPNGKPKMEKIVGWRCEDRNCKLKWIITPYLNKRLPESEVLNLLTKGKTSVLNGLTGSSGKPFSAAIVLEQDENGNYTGKTKLEYQNNKTICKCPSCEDGEIISFRFVGKSDNITHTGWRCSNKNCTVKPFYSPYFSRDFKDSEIKTLFTRGRTGMLEGFLSRAGKMFSAKVAAQRDDTGKIVATSYHLEYR